jgi:hypothetical protein
MMRCHAISAMMIATMTHAMHRVTDPPMLAMSEMMLTMEMNMMRAVKRALSRDAIDEHCFAEMRNL